MPRSGIGALFTAVLLMASSSAPALAQTLVSGGGVELSLGGRLHAQLASSSAEDGRSADLFIRRARVTLDADVTDVLDGRIQVEFAGGEASVKDAWFRMTFNPAFRLSVGQLKRAFDPFELASSTELELVERDGRIDGLDVCTGVGGICSLSRFTEKLSYSDRDMGVRVSGEGPEGRYGYQITLTNGTGVDRGDENDGKSVSGRFTLGVGGGVRLGANVGVHDYPGPGGEDTEYAAAFGGDVEVGDFRDGLHILAAVIGGDNWKVLAPDGDERTFLTAQLLATRYHALAENPWLEALEPGLRVSWGDPDLDADEDGGVLITPGLFAYVEGRNRIGLNLDVYLPAEGDTEVQLRVMTFLHF